MKKVDQIENEKPSGLKTVGLFFVELWKLIKLLPAYLLHLNQKWNEAWLLVLSFLAWKYADVVLGYIDPTVPPLPVNDLMRFLYATIGTACVHFLVSVMLRLSHPLIFRYLYGYFYQDLYSDSTNEQGVKGIAAIAKAEGKSGVTETLKYHSLKHDLKCIRLKYSLLVWLVYVATWLVLVATY